MFCNPFKGFPGQVQPVEIGIVPFQPRHDPQGLRVMVKAAIGRHQAFHRVLAGMAKGRMAKVMRQCHRLGQIGVQAKDAGDGARHLGHFDRVGQARAVVVALMFDKNLRLVLQPPKRAGMDDPVPVALIG